MLIGCATAQTSLGAQRRASTTIIPPSVPSHDPARYERLQFRDATGSSGLRCMRVYGGQGIDFHHRCLVIGGIKVHIQARIPGIVWWQLNLLRRLRLKIATYDLLVQALRNLRVDLQVLLHDLLSLGDRTIDLRLTKHHGLLHLLPFLKLARQFLKSLCKLRILFLLLFKLLDNFRFLVLKFDQFILNFSKLLLVGLFHFLHLFFHVGFVVKLLLMILFKLLFNIHYFLLHLIVHLKEKHIVFQQLLFLLIQFVQAQLQCGNLRLILCLKLH